MRIDFNKAFITGISGYIGSKLAKALIDNGKKVYGIIRKESNLINLKGYTDKIVFFDYDGTEKSIEKALAQKPDIIFHLASKNDSDDNFDNILESNLRLGVTILNSIKKNPVPFVNTSTFWIFNRKRYKPVNLYAATKMAFIDILKYYNSAYKISALTLELYDVFGDDDPRNKIINILLDSLINLKKVFLTKGEQELDLVHIDDVIKGYIVAGNFLISKRYFRHKIFSLNTGKKIKVKELIEILEKKANKKIPVVLGKIPYKERQIFKIEYKFDKLPLWESKISLESFLDDYLGKTI